MNHKKFEVKNKKLALKKRMKKLRQEKKLKEI